jgi:hypothetical protein
VLLAAARRFLLLLVCVGGAAVPVRGWVGALTGTSLNRSISLGLYLVGSVLLIGGFLAGSRGPMRRGGEEELAPMTLGRSLRRASPEELRETVNLAAVLVTLGLLLLLVAVAFDKRTDLV